MDPTNPTSPEVPVSEPEKKDGHWITIAAMALFVAASLIAVGFLYYQNQQLKNMLASYQTQATPTPAATKDPTVNWKTFQTSDFSLKYPDTLVASTSGERLTLYVKSATPDESEARIPLIAIGNKYKKSSGFVNLTQWVKSNTQLFQNLTKENEMTIENYKFLTFESDSGPSAYTIHYLIDYKENIYDFFVLIVGAHEGEGKQLSTYLPQILSTFNFLATPSTSPSATQKACTQEAKLCPDGSSVGRNGPNCEFTPCP
jgi:hypothetical protein